MLLFDESTFIGKWLYKGCLIVSKIGSDRLGISAAAVAYFTFFSLIPLLLVFMWLFTLWGASSLKDLIINGIPKFVPLSGNLLDRLLEEALSVKSWGFLGIIPLAWTGTSLFYLIEVVINSVWGLPSKGFWKGRLWGSVIVFIFLLFAVFQPVIFYVSHLLAIFENVLGIKEDSVFVWVFASLDRWILMFIIFTVIYYMTPTKRVHVKYAIVSASVSSVGTIFLEWIFVKYIAMGRIFQLYRVIADVMFLLFWFYLMGYIILIGAEVGYFLYHIDRGDLWDELSQFSDRCRFRGGSGGKKVFQKKSGVQAEESR